MANPKCVWLTPEESGGIRSYADALWPSVSAAAEASGLRFTRFDCPPISSTQAVTHVVEALRAMSPDLIHIQHEFGLFGSKIPPFYRFPDLIRGIRSELPRAKIIATAHTVLGDEALLPWRGRGLQTPVRWLLNQVAIQSFRKVWTQGTWGGLDGVVVHSKLQQSIVTASGSRHVKVIPHFVSKIPGLDRPKADQVSSGVPNLLVFGYFSPEKGQDVAIRTLAELKVPATLVCAGGVRREEDRRYLKHCEWLAKDLGVSDRVRITGFVPDGELGDIFEGATLVIAPFRETSGSGSLPQALARGVPTLASDLPLNRELNERVPGCVALFKNEDPVDCARVVAALLADSGARDRLIAGSKRYAELNAPERVASELTGFYQAILRFCPEGVS